MPGGNSSPYIRRLWPSRHPIELRAISTFALFIRGHYDTGAASSRDECGAECAGVREFFPLGGRSVVTVKENGGREKTRGVSIEWPE